MGARRNAVVLICGNFEAGQQLSATQIDCCFVGSLAGFYFG
jgi:hypothetical protein